MVKLNHDLRPLLSDWEWQAQGNCVGIDVEIFFLPEKIRGKNKLLMEHNAKQICVNCPVIKECLAHALTTPEEFGVWGGTTPDERKLLMRTLVIETE